jgi:hypothetical protein
LINRLKVLVLDEKCLLLYFGAKKGGIGAEVIKNICDSLMISLY